jgi:hypothetical protein
MGIFLFVPTPIGLVALAIATGLIARRALQARTPESHGWLAVQAV